MLVENVTIFSYFIIYSFFTLISFSFHLIFNQFSIFNENNKNKITELMKIKFQYFNKYVYII